MKRIFPVGKRAGHMDSGDPEREHPHIVALAGNPNVGKSTVFNALTGMRQHTGNWPGKTVAAASGRFVCGGERCTLIDLPGTYSLLPHSAEEEIARDYLCFEAPDAVIVVCDGSHLERGIALVLQAAELTDRLVVCVNLMDEAERRGIAVDSDKLSDLLGVPVLKTSAGKGLGVQELAETVVKRCHKSGSRPRRIPYPSVVQTALDAMELAVADALSEKGLDARISTRWLALRMLEGDNGSVERVEEVCGFSPMAHPALAEEAMRQRALLADNGFDEERMASYIAAYYMIYAESLCEDCVTVRSEEEADRIDRRLDRLFIGKRTGMLFMLLLLALVFWITIAGANAPSSWLSAGFDALREPMNRAAEAWGAPPWLRGLWIDGVYGVLTWVVSVMLPPMAIFFPLFTLLEDAGYLPRVAFNLDHRFRSCGACGKQALTTCMGFGCNAVGVTGCRIIDSPRERLIAILTNSFVPCNGRFPLLTAIISMFCLGSVMAPLDSLLSALLLTGLICLSLGMTFAVSKLLSATLLKGMPSSFALELPPYRRPRVLRVLVRSMLDRTLFVLGRAAAVAAPAGAVIWLLANVEAGGESLLSIGSGALDPLGRLLGMDGVILMAFLLGFPANETVMPLIMMMYLSQGRLTEMHDLHALRELLVANGWTLSTAVCTMLFSLLHWPCSTTCITIYKETHSVKWTAAAILLPALAGAAICLAVHGLFGLCGW